MVKAGIPGGSPICHSGDVHASGAKDAFERFLADQGIDWRSGNATAVFDALVDWYESERADDVVPFDDDGDMLIFQWGTWGDTFDVTMTRQFILTDELDDPFRQLQLTLHFEPDIQTRVLGSGTHWCGRPEDVQGFRETVASAHATSYARDENPKSVDLLMDGT